MLGLSRGFVSGRPFNPRLLLQVRDSGITKMVVSLTSLGFFLDRHVTIMLVGSCLLKHQRRRICSLSSCFEVPDPDIQPSMSRSESCLCQLSLDSGGDPGSEFVRAELTLPIGPASAQQCLLQKVWGPV